MWRSCDVLAPAPAAVVKLLILTGCRREEVSAMRWSELDLSRLEFALPAERAKNGCGLVIPLSPLAVEILKSMTPVAQSDFVFADANGESPRTWGFKLKKLRAAAGITDFTLHDLRRSVASGLPKVKVQPHVIEACLNHRSGVISGVAAIYNQYSYFDERRVALDAWSRHIQWVLDGKPESSNVIAFATSV